MMTPETIEVGQLFVWEHNHEGMVEVGTLENDRVKRELLVKDHLGRLYRLPYSQVRFVGRLEEVLKQESAKLDWILRHCHVSFTEEALAYPVIVSSRKALEYVMGLYRAEEIRAEGGLTGL